MARSRSASARHYPSWVFVPREDMTRRNMELYDHQQAQIDARCLVLAPNYYSLDARSRFVIRKQAENDLGIN